MIDEREDWSMWWTDTWCPILGAVPEVDGMSEADFAGKAASIIHRLRADFFGRSLRTVAESAQGANWLPDPADDPLEIDPNRIAQARVIQREAMNIEKEALWALDTWRTTRDGEAEPLRLAGAAAECRDGRQSASVASFERLLMTAVDRALEFALSFAQVRGDPPPFKPTKWPIHDALAVLAIHSAADAIYELLTNCKAYPQERRLRRLMDAQELDRMAREYKALADAKAEPSRRGSKTRGVSRPNAQSPLRVSLQVLVDRGLSNPEILRFLSDDEGIADDCELPIETNEPETNVLDDGFLVWFPRGGTSGKPTRTAVKTIVNLLSKVRNPV